MLTQIHLHGPTRASTDRCSHEHLDLCSHEHRDLTAQVYGRQQILAAPSLYPSITRGDLGCKAELSLGEAAGAGSSILPNWCIQTLCSSLVPPCYSPTSRLHLHWSSTRLQDNKVTIHLNRIFMWNCSYLNCSPCSPNCYLLQGQKTHLKKYPLVINLFGYQSSCL